MARKKKWIQKAIQRPGRVRALAKRLGLIKGDEKLSKSDVKKLKAYAKKKGDRSLISAVNLAERFVTGEIKKKGKRRKTKKR